MTQQPNDFESLVVGLFTPEEEDSFNKQLSGPFLEPLYPGRQELLEHFDVLLEQMLCAKSEGEGLSYKEKFLTSMALINELEPGMLMKLTNVASCITETETGRLSVGVFSDPARLSGRFGGMAIGAWFDVVPGEEPTNNEGINPFFRPHGIHVCLEDVTIELRGEEYQVPGFTRLPLNHGAPEIFRLHCPE